MAIFSNVVFELIDMSIDHVGPDFMCDHGVHMPLSRLPISVSALPSPFSRGTGHPLQTADYLGVRDKNRVGDGHVFQRGGKIKKKPLRKLFR